MNVFVAADAIRLGQEWWATIKAALRESRVLLCLLDNVSIGRPWVPFEAGAFWLLDKPVIPVCLEPIRKGTMPFPFAALQGVDLPEELFQLMAAVHGHVRPGELMLPPKLDDDMEEAFLRTLQGEPFLLPMPPPPPRHY